MEDVASYFLSTLTEKLGYTPERSDPIFELGADSLMMAEFLYEVEQKYGIKVDEHLLAGTTVEELAAYVQAKLTERAS